MKQWEIIADRLHDAGWSLGWVSAIDSEGQTIWIVDAHGYGKHTWLALRRILRHAAVLTVASTICQAFRAMRPNFAVSAIVTVASFLAVCPYACPFGPDPEPVRKIAHLRLEIIRLDASLIKLMSEAENSISEDVESLHTCIVAEQTETVDTAAAYREAKSLIRDLDVLRKRAIADLTLPPTYTPPDVAAEPLPTAMTDLRPALESSYQDVATATRLMVTDIDAPALHIEKRLETLATEENISIRNMLQIEMMLNQLSQLSEAVKSIISASNSAIASMARNAKP